MFNVVLVVEVLVGGIVILVDVSRCGQGGLQLLVDESGLSLKGIEFLVFEMQVGMADVHEGLLGRSQA